MIKMDALLKTDHHRQIAWLDGQIKKNNTSIFLNAPLAIKAYDAFSAELLPSDQEIEKFIFRYLSEQGKRKLITTLRVADTRRKNSCLSRLQVNLEPKNNRKLDKLVKKSGLSKTELINMMIDGATWVQKKEEQLKIDI